MKHQYSPTTVKIRSSLYYSVLLPVVTLVLLVGLFYVQIRNLLQLSDLVQEHQDNIYRGSILLRSMIDMETGVRGYFMSGNPQFLQPFHEGHHRFDESMPQLQRRVLNDGPQAARLAQIDQLEHAWLNHELQSIELFQQGRITRAQLSELELNGKGRMDDLRESFSDFAQVENDAVETRRVQTTENATRALGWGSMIGLGIGCLLALLIRSQIRRVIRIYEDNTLEIREAQAKLYETNSNLEKIVESRTHSLQMINQELEAFSYSVSHDLRAPLRGIDGFSQALVEDYQTTLDERGRKYLNFIRQGVQRMGHLIDDLLNLARLNRIEIRLEKIDLAKVARDVFEDMKSVTEIPTANVEFKIEGEGSSFVMADRGLMMIVLENLIGNSIKYSAEREKVEIRFEYSSHGPERMQFQMTDNGAGFDMQYAEKLFKPFQRLHSAGQFKGSGIGLATVKRIISRHGGEIWAESAQGQGARFYFTLARPNSP